MANRSLGIGWSEHAPHMDVTLEGETQVQGPMGAVLQSDPEPPRVVETRTPEAGNYAAFTIAVINTGQNMVLGEDPNRRKAIILNSSTVSIVLGKRGRATTGTALGSSGFILPAGVQITYESGQAIFANLVAGDLAPAGTAATVSVLTYRD